MISLCHQKKTPSQYLSVCFGSHKAKLAAMEPAKRQVPRFQHVVLRDLPLHKLAAISVVSMGVKVSGDKNGDNVVYQIVYQINHPFLEVLILTHTPTAPEKSENQEPTPHETIAEKLCESAF